MKIAVIIVHFGKIETTKTCLKELNKKINNNRVILINNTSDDISSLAKIIPATQVIENKTNLGFAKAVNQGIKIALADPSITHILLLNNDLILSFGSLSQLTQAISQGKNVGIVSPILHHAGGYDWGGKYNKWLSMVKHANWPNKPKTVQSVAHVAGAAMLLSRQVVEVVGMFDEQFFMYYEDLDYCLRAAQAGFTINIVPDVVAEHLISSSTNSSQRAKYQWASHLKFINKHLFKLAYPTAYLYNLIFYPLVLLKLLLINHKS